MVCHIFCLISSQPPETHFHHLYTLYITNPHSCWHFPALTPSISFQVLFSPRAVLSLFSPLVHIYLFLTVMLVGLGTPSKFIKTQVFRYSRNSLSCFGKQFFSLVSFPYSYYANYCKLSGLKPHKFVVLQFCRLEKSDRGLDGVK